MITRLLQRFGFVCRQLLSEDSRISIAAAGGCFAAGLIGWSVNIIAPGSTMLDALMVVAAVYLAIGVSTRFEKKSVVAVEPPKGANQRVDDNDECCVDAPTRPARSVA